MSRFSIDAITREAQRNASDPGAGAWVSANAGSGKTYVLTLRVLRLLLSGVDPSRILCLTFTKAAAAEMSNRIFAELSAWTGLDDATLGRRLAELGAPETDLRAARRLFAGAVETPGGLKVETIHAFCTRVLQMAPFEANVPAGFVVLDEAASARLRDEARRSVFFRAAGGADPDLAAAIDRVACDVGDAKQLDTLMKQAAAHAAWGQNDELSTVLEIEPTATKASVNAAFLGGGLQGAVRDRVVAAWSRGTKTDVSRALVLKAMDVTSTDDAARHAYLKLFMTKDMEPLRSQATKSAKDFDDGLEAILVAEADRLSALLRTASTVALRDRTLALGRLALAERAALARLKAGRGLLDYDDLIARTATLLARQGAGWVLHKLDSGLSHVLIDEAQDTSPEQWDILRALTAEFTAGEGASRTAGPRTVFAVGDEKQSIFSFQGARPETFAHERRGYETAFGDAGMPFRMVPLNTSFRATRDVLDFVDAVFADPAHAQGLSFDDAGPTTHVSARRADTGDDRGAVDLWPIEEKTRAEDREGWRKPLDAVDSGDSRVLLARKIATTLRRWITEGCDHDPDIGHEPRRSVRPGDVLILARSRGPLFGAILKALKDQDVPVAGADRLSPSTHLAVEDLIAVGRTALCPDDDLTLAAVLASPLVGLDEAGLFDLAHARPGSLRKAVRARAATDPQLAAIDRTLDRWRLAAMAQTPFAFYARLLGPERGRRLLVGQLGSEAGDAIDAFVQQAQLHERSGPASMARFLHDIAGDASELKRELSAGGGEVRVMTTHGAKGLEAPIVILADTMGIVDGRRIPKVLELAGPDGAVIPVWAKTQDKVVPAVAAVRSRWRAEQEAEQRRLFYVALTRAADHLIIAGAESRRNKADGPVAPAGSWYAMAQATFDAQAAIDEPGNSDRITTITTQDTAIRRFRTTTGPLAQPRRDPASASPATVIEPSWFVRPAPPEPAPAPPLRPSGALDAADRVPRQLDDPVETSAMLRGRLTHLLLEHLPAVDPLHRDDAGRALLRTRGRMLEPDVRERILSETLTILARPDLAALFGAQSLAEVSVSGEVHLDDATVRAVSGRIDRLAVTSDAVIFADYKTGARAPRDAASVSAAALGQIAIYDALLRQIYPDRPVRALLIFAAGPVVIEPTRGQLDHALTRLSSA